MNHLKNLDFIIFWSSMLTLMVLSHKANGILTDSNDLHCTHIQCPTKCPKDSYLKVAFDDEDEDFEDYEVELFGHGSYIDEQPPEVEMHETHSPQHILKERQKREVFFQKDIEKCCDDQKCLCHKCEEVPKCTQGYVAVEIHEGQGVPGNCCSIFKCIQKEVCQLGMKQSWWTSKCTKCSCFGENELCMQICPEEEILQNCYSEYLQMPMMNGAFWKEGSCTSCSCEQGDRRCLTPVCPKLNCKEFVTLEDDCCPKCNGNETDERPEIVHNRKIDIDYNVEDYTTESATEDTSIADTKEENNSTVSDHISSVSVVYENTLNGTQTTSSPIDTTESSTVSLSPQTIEDISSTFPSASSETYQQNVSHTKSTTFAPSSYELMNFSLPSVSEISSTKEPKSKSSTDSISIAEHEHDSSIASTATEEVTSTKRIDLDFISTASFSDSVQASSTPTTETIEDLLTEVATSNVDCEITNATQTTFISTSTAFIDVSTNSEATMSSTSATPMELSSNTLRDSFTELNNTLTTILPINTTILSSNIFSTSASNKSTTSTETSTETAISLSAAPVTSSSHTTDSPFDSANETSKPNYATSSISTECPTSSSTSTTSAPYSPTSDATSSYPEELTTTTQSTSTTTAPEALKPLFQSYGDLNSDEHFTSTQNRMRIMFDEVDYVVMIVLFVGSILCISLGLIIRHTKNRKKMYSSIPNSETSLSQTSTNTILTV